MWGDKAMSWLVMVSGVSAVSAFAAMLASNLFKRPKGR
jgi:hypothetical protein